MFIFVTTTEEMRDKHLYFSNVQSCVIMSKISRLRILFALLIIFGIFLSANTNFYTNFPGKFAQKDETSSFENLLPTNNDRSLSLQNGEIPTIIDTYLSQELESVSSDRVLNYTLNVFFLGFTKAQISPDALDVPTTITPLVGNRENSYSNAITYQINYNYTYLEIEELQKFQNKIVDLGKFRTTPDFSRFFSNPALNNYSGSFIAYLSSNAIEEYLYSNYQSISGFPAIFFIDTYTLNKDAWVPHFYDPSYLDESGDTSPYLGFNNQIAGGGNNHSLFWVDFSAGPTEFPDSSISESYTLHSGEQDLLNSTSSFGVIKANLSYYLETVLKFRFLHSSLDVSIPSQNVMINIFLVDTSMSSDINFLQLYDLDFVRDQYRQINPHLNWEINFTELDLTNDTEFQNALENSKQSDTVYGEFLINFLVQDFPTNNFPPASIQSSAHTLVIPVYIIVLPEQGQVEGLSGFSVPKTRIVVFTNEASSKSELTNLNLRKANEPSFDIFVVMHEIGHFIGLEHPFIAIFETEVLEDRFWDMTTTQMGYSSYINDISLSDLKTAQRSWLSVYLFELVSEYNQVVNQLSNQQYVPTEIPLEFNELATKLDNWYKTLVTRFATEANRNITMDIYPNCEM